MLLKKYVEWDKYADRFGYVTLTRESLRRILQATDDNKLIVLPINDLPHR